ncbi:DUF4190 domain-containing protein [Amycolatopsis sp. lyj-112]|uniref:DUF4190 domain-containing protein n=1 Tax=Amycolatopsis sp. lyj-112 TaxID=2789288 RepID=UPI003979AD2A
MSEQYPFEPSRPADPLPPGQHQPSPPQWMAVAPGPAAPAGRNGFAVAALIMGILGLCGLSLIFGLIFGIVALVQINRTGQTGKGMAITGIVLSLVWVLVITVAALALVEKTSFNGTTPAIVALKEGDCYTTPPAYGLDAAKVDCSAPHDGEAFATFPLTEDAYGYPGGDSLAAEAKKGCEDRRLKVFGEGFSTPVEVAVGAFYPDQAAWNTGNHKAVCTMQVTGDGQLTGKLRG